MKRAAPKYLLIFCILAASLGIRTLDEGMWLPDAIKKLPLTDMKRRGLELTPEQIFSANGPSLKDAIMVLSGGTASFVSPQGLILTNHHVAFGGIQALSSVESDYLKNGFYAGERREELPTTYTADVIVAMKDVTDEVMSATNAGMTDDERDRSIRQKSKEIENKGEENGSYNARVTAMFGEMKYYLIVSERLLDIRLVYAPPQAIGNYGGEVDNWMWPRHTGDFSFMRAYVGANGMPAKYAKENTPYKPRAFLPISTKGYSEGSFAMIMGFPGRTFRYREASAVRLAREETLPTTIDLYAARIRTIEHFSRNDRAIAIKYASKLRRLGNSYKNYQATLDGMRKADLVALKEGWETEFSKHVASRPELTAKFGGLLAELEKTNDEMRATAKKQIALNNIGDGIDLLKIASRFRSYARVVEGKSGETNEKELERLRGQLRDFIGSTMKDLDPNVDREVMVQLLLKAAGLPTDQRINFVRNIVGNTSDAAREEKVRRHVDDLFSDSKIITTEGCEQLLREDADEILDDSFVRFAASFSDEQSPVQTTANALNNTLSRLRARFVEAWLDWKRPEVAYPDANRTLRLTYGEVKPLHPRDAVQYTVTTTLTGVMEKETGQDPFIVPGKLKELWRKRDFGRYADPQLQDVPVAFLTNNDITGGNSGSPIINGKGEVIGCAFDGNWEGVVGDYIFQEKLNRTIAVDSRYILFILDKFSGAATLLKEMAIH